MIADLWMLFRELMRLGYQAAILKPKVSGLPGSFVLVMIMALVAGLKDWIVFGQVMLLPLAVALPLLARFFISNRMLLAIYIPVIFFAFIELFFFSILGRSEAGPMWFVSSVLSGWLIGAILNVIFVYRRECGDGSPGSEK